jgi:hypothetical protein
VHRNGQDQISCREKEHEEQEGQRACTKSGQPSLVKMTDSEDGAGYADRDCYTAMPGRALKIPEQETAKDAFFANARGKR